VTEGGPTPPPATAGPSAPTGRPTGPRPATAASTGRWTAAPRIRSDAPGAADRPLTDGGAPTLIALSLAPPLATVGIGTSVLFVATGVFSDGTTSDLTGTSAVDVDQHDGGQRGHRQGHRDLRGHHQHPRDRQWA
jgi:hypothetical protein